jgi:hypothetical protein
MKRSYTPLILLDAGVVACDWHTYSGCVVSVIVYQPVTGFDQSALCWLHDVNEKFESEELWAYFTLLSRGMLLIRVSSYKCIRLVQMRRVLHRIKLQQWYSQLLPRKLYFQCTCNNELFFIVPHLHSENVGTFAPFWFLHNNPVLIGFTDRDSTA